MKAEEKKAQTKEAANDAAVGATAAAQATGALRAVWCWQHCALVTCMGPARKR